MNEIGWGIAGVLLGGFLNGSWIFPSKRMPGWRWENTWMVYSVVGLLIVPWIVAVAVVPGLIDIFRQASGSAIAAALGFGFSWGLGNILFGLGVARMGLAVGYGLILGLIAPIGTFLPLIVLHPERLRTREGYALIAGTVIVIVGIILCAKAGSLREKAAAGTPQAPRSSFGTGLLICILSGIFSPGLTFSFVFGDELTRRALEAGASTAMASNAVWCLCLTAGFVANAGYAAILLQKNRTWGLFSTAKTPPGYWLGASIMGIVCFASFMTYGSGATALGGVLGAIVGWPLFMSMALITSNVLGAAGGEWKGAPRQAYSYSIAGIGLLIIAIVVISLGRA